MQQKSRLGKHLYKRKLGKLGINVQEYVMLRSHYHDSRHDWYRGTNRELIVVILSDLEFSRGSRVNRRTILNG